MTPLLAASASQTATGYLYELLRLLGASPGTAKHVQDLLLRPVAVLIIIVVAAVVAHLGSTVVRRSLRSLRTRAEARSDARREGSPTGRDPDRLGTVIGRIDMVGRIAANIWRVVVWVIALLSILGVLGIDLAPFVAGATVLGATIGFGAQTLVKDYLSGFLLLAEDQFRIGDDVSTASATGVVEEMTLRVTRLKGDDGTVWYVPNGDIRTLGNTSRASASSHVDIVVPIGTPIDRAGRLIEEAARRVAATSPLDTSCTEPPNLLGVEDVDAANVTFRVALHTVPGQGAPLARAVRAAVTADLVEAGLLAPALSSAPPPVPQGRPAPPPPPG